MWKNIMGNSHKMSRFLCLSCMKENKVGEGIQRRKMRSKYHIKDLYCNNCHKVTKNMEIRYCDYYEDIYNKAKEVKDTYY